MHTCALSPPVYNYDKQGEELKEFCNWKRKEKKPSVLLQVAVFDVFLVLLHFYIEATAYTIIFSSLLGFL